jgi:hypothetical protein
MKLYNLKVDENDLRELKVLAAKKDTSAAELIRQAIKKIIKDEK